LEVLGFREMGGLGQLHIGTSAFTAAGWPGSFYPQGLPSGDYLSYYATKFDTVEVDSTFYGTPKASTVRRWYHNTPKGFTFALKVPQLVTHQKVLQDCRSELREFLAVADILAEKLGPLLFQFPYFRATEFETVDQFLTVLIPFLGELPHGPQLAVEIRNKFWLVPSLAHALRERGIALALVDRSWLLPTPSDWFRNFDPVTADFCYVRLLGDRKEIERQTMVWNKIIVDRSEQLQGWVTVCQQLVRRGVTTYVYANNHYQGFGPGTVEQFRQLWARPGMPELKRPEPNQSRLFE
jgi:uncharacterized protein YecE (DUF72 family)